MSRVCQSVAGGLSRTDRDRYETPRDQHGSLANTRLWWAQKTNDDGGSTRDETISRLGTFCLPRVNNQGQKPYIYIVQ